MQMNILVILEIEGNCF